MLNIKNDSTYFTNIFLIANKYNKLYPYLIRNNEVKLDEFFNVSYEMILLMSICLDLNNTKYYMNNLNLEHKSEKDNKKPNNTIPNPPSYNRILYTNFFIYDEKLSFSTAKAELEVHGSQNKITFFQKAPGPLKQIKVCTPLEITCIQDRNQHSDERQLVRSDGLNLKPASNDLITETKRKIKINQELTFIEKDDSSVDKQTLLSEFSKEAYEHALQTTKAYEVVKEKENQILYYTLNKDHKVSLIGEDTSYVFPENQQTKIQAKNNDDTHIVEQLGEVSEPRVNSNDQAKYTDLQKPDIIPANLEKTVESISHISLNNQIEIDIKRDNDNLEHLNDDNLSIETEKHHTNYYNEETSSSRYANKEQFLSPMRGRLISMCVEKNQQITKGQPLLVIEMMKMQIKIRSELDGIVTDIFVNDEEIILTGQSLLEIAEIDCI